MSLSVSRSTHWSLQCATKGAHYLLFLLSGFEMKFFFSFKGSETWQLCNNQHTLCHSLCACPEKIQKYKVTLIWHQKLEGWKKMRRKIRITGCSTGEGMDTSCAKRWTILSGRFVCVCACVRALSLGDSGGNMPPPSVSVSRSILCRKVALATHHNRGMYINNK